MEVLFMAVPVVCFVSYNRLGVTASNLDTLLKTEDDFELYIVDNFSMENNWDYIMSLKDERIKEIKRFRKNYGSICAINYGLSHRDEKQSFVHIENDVSILDKNWVKKFEHTQDTFPELALIGAVSKGYIESLKRRFPISESINMDSEWILKNKNVLILKPMSRNNITTYFFPNILGNINYMTPNILKHVGYWSEEVYGGDAEMCGRINRFTEYYTAITTNFYIDIIDFISCNQCIAQDYCSYDKKIDGQCCQEYLKKKSVSYTPFYKQQNVKTNEFLDKIKDKSRSLYCASIHDAESMINNQYDYENSINNFNRF
jgi:hypothetical protein